MTITGWRLNARTVSLLATGLALIVWLLVEENHERRKCVGIGYPAEIHDDLNNATPWPISRLVMFRKRRVGVVFDSVFDRDLRVKVVVSESDTEVRIGLLIESAKARTRTTSDRPGYIDYVGGTRRYVSVDLASPIGTRALLKSPPTFSSITTRRWPLTSYVGLSVEQATDKAENDNRKYRKIHLDQAPTIRTMDVRLNFYIRDKQGAPTVVGVSNDTGEFAGAVRKGYCHP